MKYMNVTKRFGMLNLQLFAEDGGEDGSGADDEGDGDEDSDPDGDGDENAEEKKFSQKDVDEAVKKRLARERRKWQRSQQKKREPDGRVKGAGNDDDGEDEETKTLREKAEKADELELKWACLEHDVDKSYVDDVLALAKTRMVKDDGLDIEDAIEEVLKKYPHFKESSKKEGDEDGTKGKSWGERQRGQRKKTSGVEAAFLKKNPGLKIE